MRRTKVKLCGFEILTEQNKPSHLNVGDMKCQTWPAINKFMIERE